MRRLQVVFHPVNSNGGGPRAGHRALPPTSSTYNGGAPNNGNTINEVAAKGYAGVVLVADRGAAPSGKPADGGGVNCVPRT